MEDTIVINASQQASQEPKVDGSWAVKLDNPYNDYGTLVALVCLLLASTLFYYKKYSHWSYLNVKSPLPAPIFGNLLAYVSRPREQVDLEWIRKFGRVFGYYLGTTPYLIVADADVVKQIAIKDFNIFPNHRIVPVKNKYQEKILITQHDDHWRAMRAIISPTFASGRIKSMFFTMDTCARELVDFIKVKLGESQSMKLESKDVFTTFAMKVSLQCFYGIKLDPSDKSAEVAKTQVFARKSTQAFTPDPVRILMASLLPSAIQRMLGMTAVPAKLFEFFYDKAKSIVIHRRNNPKPSNHVDLLRLLVEATADSKVETTDNDKYEDHHVNNEQNNDGQLWRSSGMKLEEEQVFCVAMEFMNVSTQTTSELLTNTIYLMANHMNIQEKLYNEIVAISDVDEHDTFSFNYDKITACQYLDCVISESLRFMPQVIEMDRESNQDYYIGQPYNIHLPKNSIVKLAYYAIHKDPEYWPQPDKFEPDRFRPENRTNIKPGSYNPFGNGPRACIGFRFALTEVKIALARLLTEFKFEPAIGVPYPPELKKYTFVISTYKNLDVKCSRR